MFPPSIEPIIFVSANYSFVKITSYCLNPNLVLNLYAAVALQYLITLVANSLCVKILLACFFGSSASSYLCYLWSE